MPLIRVSFIFMFSLSLAVSSNLHAQTPAAEPAPKVMGWSKTANLGANISFTSSDSVVGQTDGSSQTYGSSLKSTFNRLSETDEWRNSVTLIASTTRTPSVPRYVKSSDETKLDTLYLHPFSRYPKLGPYARGEVSAPLFKGEDVRSSETTYRIVSSGGDETTQTGTTLRLTDGLKPTTSKEAVGLLWKAVDQERLKFETRGGFGAMQIAADGQRIVTGQNDAGEIVVNELDDLSQAGLELGAALKGKVAETSAYEVGIESLTPFINNKRAGDRRDAVELTNIDGYIKLTSNITSWASFGYDYKLKIQPQLQVPAQQIHMMVLNVSYNLL